MFSGSEGKARQPPSRLSVSNSIATQTGATTPSSPKPPEPWVAESAPSPSQASPPTPPPSSSFPVRLIAPTPESWRAVAFPQSSQTVALPGLTLSQQASRESGTQEGHTPSQWRPARTTMSASEPWLLSQGAPNNSDTTPAYLATTERKDPTTAGAAANSSAPAWSPRGPIRRGNRRRRRRCR